MAERTAADPNSADVLYTVAKEELKKFEVGCSFLPPFPASAREMSYSVDLWISGSPKAG